MTRIVGSGSPAVYFVRDRKAPTRLANRRGGEGAPYIFPLFYSGRYFS
jgi:hypothetical protein